MADAWVLKIPRSDDKQGHVLVQVSRKNAHSDLDLTLFASEGEAPYTAKGVSHHSASTLAPRRAIELTILILFSMLIQW